MENIKKLSDPLERKDIEFRIAKVWESGDTVWCSILAYKDARTDMQVLDDVVGPMNWSNEYKRDSKGVLQCGIGIFSDESPTKGFVWKWSNGTPSNFESEKGEYSDAFKRAGFMWGIGRQLYDFPGIFVQLSNGDYYERSGKIAASQKLRPNDWKWDISKDYQFVTAKRKYGNTWKEVYNSEPFKKKSV